MDPRLFHRRVYEGARGIVPSGSAVVCAVSGGPDSMAMLHALAAVNQRKRLGWRLHAAYLDHGMHARSHEAERIVRGSCERLGLALSTGRADVRAIARREGQTIEEAGRNTRYAFLEGVAEEIGVRRVAVAHHADDQAETVLQRIVRGTGLRGLGAMRPRRRIRPGSGVYIVRPLLSLRRTALRDYLSDQSIPFFSDPTNEDVTAATRNRIRGELVPQLVQRFNPKTMEALTRLATQAREAHAALAWAARELLGDLVLDEARGVVELNAPAMADLPRGLQTHVIRELLRRHEVGLKGLTRERLDAIAALVNGVPRGRRILELAGGAIVERRGRALTIRTSKGARTVKKNRVGQPIA